MKLALIKFSLYLIFIVSLITGVADLVGGATSIPGATGSIAASVDNELRCLAIFWLAFGVFCLWVVRNLNDRAHFLLAIALVLLVSAAARLLSVLTVGMPATPLLVAMIVEFVLAITIYFCRKANSQ
jgi:uncharacterized membrane protein